MIAAFEHLVRPLLHALDPEDAHALTLKLLKFAPVLPGARDDPRLAVRAFGLNFPNPVGMAAGFDKNAEVPDALLRLGFGFVEVGTITPRPQPGNPRPRLFRLDADGGVINRLGFNSQGADAVLAAACGARAMPAASSASMSAPTRTRPTASPTTCALIERFAAVASYVTVNISSPNTPGLRDLQQATALDDLLARVVDARERVAPNAGPTPVLLKIAPDLSLAELDDVVGIARSRRVDGMIVGNTTLARPPSLRETKLAQEAGGLSGRPLLRARDPHAGRNLCAGRRRVPADRGRRHRFAAQPRSPKSAPAQRCCSFIRRWCSAASAWSPTSNRRWSARSSASASTASPN